MVPSPYALSALAVALAVPPISSLFGLRVNVSESMPIGVYRLIAGLPERDSLVAFCLVGEMALLGRSRGYLHAGSCASGTEPLLKRTVAVGGDVVDHEARYLAVNGATLPRSATAERDVAGRVLPHLAFGVSVVPEGTIWVFSDAARSWDSRYFGPIRVEDTIGRALPIVTTGLLDGHHGSHAG